jgi:CRISPR-associated protein Csd1
MILQSLAKYYDVLLEDSENEDGVPSPGYSMANVSYALNLSSQGELLDIFPLLVSVQRGKKTVEKPRRMIVPEQAGRSGSTPPPYFLCDNNVYILGIAAEDEKRPGYSLPRFEAFRALNTRILSQANCPEAKAVVRFLATYDPSQAKEHPVISRYLDEFIKSKPNFVFMVNGHFVHQNKEISKAWEAYNEKSENEYVGQCLITGEMAPIAILHSIKIKGIPPFQGGVALVGFNDRAYESYNRTNGQGLNSPVSKSAMLAYSKALNYLLASDGNKVVIGNTTIVFWAETGEKKYTNFIMSLFQPEPEEPGTEITAKDKEAESLLRNIARKLKQGKGLDEKALYKELDGNTRFYILGLEAPNRGRAAIRFFIHDPFKKLVNNINQHYKDLSLEGGNRSVSLSPKRILYETVSKKTPNQEPAPLLAGGIFRSMFHNTPYPAALYYAIINRIRADMDDKENSIEKINYLRAALIKAFLIRKYRYQTQHPIQEVLVMSLNDQSSYAPYVLGRLFAVLEKAQKEAIGDANATIKDRYFTSACASPGTVFPVLLRLSQHHISKAEYGYVSDRRIQDILNLLDIDSNPIPARLNLDEQGAFVLGYYHQRAAFYIPKNKEEKQQDQ